MASVATWQLSHSALALPAQVRTWPPSVAPVLASAPTAPHDYTQTQRQTPNPSPRNCFRHHSLRRRRRCHYGSGDAQAAVAPRRSNRHSRLSPSASTHPWKIPASGPARRFASGPTPLAGIGIRPSVEPLNKRHRALIMTMSPRLVLSRVRAIHMSFDAAHQIGPSSFFIDCGIL